MKAKSIVYKGCNIIKGKTESGNTWYAASNPKGGPAFFCSQLSIAKKFIDKKLKS